MQMNSDPKNFFLWSVFLIPPPLPCNISFRLPLLKEMQSKGVFIRHTGGHLYQLKCAMWSENLETPPRVAITSYASN